MFSKTEPILEWEDVDGTSSASILECWHPHVDSLARIWGSRNTSWRVPETTPTKLFIEPDQQANAGLLFIKYHKASSSTCSGIALRMAHHNIAVACLETHQAPA
jgi:hypothetical protein